jgi:TRAP-type C4-dicarboxylate transport system permease small subunit
LHVNIDLVTQHAGPRLKRGLVGLAVLSTVVYCLFFLK